MWQQWGWALVIVLTLILIVLALTAKPGALFEEFTSQDEESEQREEETNVVEGSLEGDPEE